MKNISLLLIPVFLMSLFSCKKSIVIENPDYISNGGTRDISYRINRIELTDAATIFDMEFYHFPGYWVKISSDTKLKGVNTGKEYSLYKSKGMTPDSLEWMQKEAFRTTTLYFEPIDPADKEVDFIESDEWIIKGIKLKETAKGKINTNLSGKLDVFGGSWLKVVEAGDDPYFGKTIVVPVRNGKFSYDFYTDEPRLYLVIIGKQFRSGSLRPAYFWTEGDSVKLIYDNEDIENFVISGGKLTEELNDYLKETEEEENRIYKGYQSKIKELKEKKLFKTPELMELEFRLENEAIGRERENLLNEIMELYQNDKAYTPEGKKLSEEYSLFYENNKDSIMWEILKFEKKEFSKPSMTGLGMLYSNVRQPETNVKEFIQIFLRSYKDFHPEHPYHKYLTEISKLYEP